MRLLVLQPEPFAIKVLVTGEPFFANPQSRIDSVFDLLGLLRSVRIAVAVLIAAALTVAAIATGVDWCKQHALQYSEGQTAHNPTTGQRIIFHNGRWEPLR